MNKLILIGLALSVSSVSFAQSKLDIGSRARLRQSKMPVEFIGGKDTPARILARTTKAEPMLHAFITLADGASAEALTEAGATVHSFRGKMALAEFPESALEAIESLEEVVNIRLEQQVDAKMDRARAVSGIDKIHSGLDLPQAYTGKGVIVGSVDGGFDPNHINFKNSDGTNRIGQFTYYRPTQQGGYTEQIVPREGIWEIDTETAETFHGTHTLGIMAGSYRGNANVAVANGMKAEVQTLPNPYYGVAYDADIAVASGASTDYYIALGIETILTYAYDQGQKSSVVNLSLGSNVGPHDGTSTICQYMDLASVMDPVIFCVSAGNEGDLPIALHKTFTAEDNTISSILKPEVPMTNYQNVRYGATYIYSDSEEPFDVQIIVYNKMRGAVAMRMPLEASSEGSSKYWVSDNSFAESDVDIVSSQFARYFTGYAGIGAELDKESGRYMAVIDCMCWDNTVTNGVGNYILGFEITGKDGQRVDVYGDGIYNTFNSYDIAGFMDGMTDGSISDMACGHNYVVVGSYNTRQDWPSLDGEIYTYNSDFPYGKVTSFSSYGTLTDGRQLPTICAPGATIISSSNEYYLEAEQAGDFYRQASVKDNDRTYSWHQCAGTSMSSPLVAGSIALWLEAYPELNYEQVLDIIKKTAVVDDDVREGDPVKWGAGKFDAYAGLKEVLALKNAGVSNVSATSDNRLLISSYGDRRFGIHYEAAEGYTATLYSVSGMAAASAVATGHDATIDTTDLAAGVYIVSVPGAQAQRILVK